MVQPTEISEYDSLKDYLLKLYEIRDQKYSEPKKEELIQEINEAFKGVKLEGGLPLKKGFALIKNRLEDVAKINYFDECENWEKITCKALKKYWHVSLFFDAKSFHYHLPAYLICHLAGPQVLDGASIFNYTASKSELIKKYECFNYQQISITINFLKHVMTQPFDISNLSVIKEYLLILYEIREQK